MRDVPSEIRILPMSKKEFSGQTADEVQSHFFLKDLPSRPNGQYFFRTRGLSAEPNTVVLFQYENCIIASAVFNGRKPLELRDDCVYLGTLNFDVDSIRVFDPVGPDQLRDVWPEFERFGNARLRLDANAFPEFERRLTGVKAPTHPEPEVHDLDAPTPAHALTTVSRIVRDTELSRQIKGLHDYKCQICGNTIVTASGRYAEGHHIRPLGGKHHGPDVAENIVCLCPNHHAACDLGAIQLVAAELRQVTGHVVGQKFLDYHNQEIYPFGRCPDDGQV